MFNLAFSKDDPIGQISQNYASLSVTDTVKYGGLDLYRVKPWQFSPNKPDSIGDRINLTDSRDVDVFGGIKELKKDSSWSEYGWFELAFEVDSALASKPWWLAYFEPAAAKIWINGVLVSKLGNPSKSAKYEELAPLLPQDNPVQLRKGLNYLLVEWSEHTAPYAFHQLRLNQNRLALILRKPFDKSIHIQRSYLFGAALSVILFLIFLYGFLSRQFPNQRYHRYILITLFFLGIHAFFGLGNSVFNWSYDFFPFQISIYELSFLFGFVVYLISIRELFALKHHWKGITLFLTISVISIILGLLFNYRMLLYLDIFIGFTGFIYGLYSLKQARISHSKEEVRFIQLGLILTMIGVLSYLLSNILFKGTYQLVYITSVLMVYLGIPLSLTLQVAKNYVVLLRTLDHKVKERTEELQQANSYQKLLFANISHEFRTPLTISMGLVNKMLETEAPKNTDISKKLETVDRNMSRLKDMIHQIIDLSQSDEHHLTLNLNLFEADKLTRLLAESFQSMAESKHQEFNIYTNAGQVGIEIDRDRYEIIINNLISNAIKFTPVHGLIEVTSLVHQNKYEVRVSDSGPGVPEIHREKIFERFHRIRENAEDYIEGMGIGLELSRKLARVMGGEITYEAADPTGSVFTLILPISNNEIEECDVSDEEQIEQKEIHVPYSEPIKQKKHTILLVEDNAEMQVYVKEILDEIGNVHLAANGIEALKMIQESLPDIVVTDLMMPEMDGNKLIDELRKNPTTERLPVVVLSAKSLKQERLDILRIGVIDYISKPFLADELKFKIQNLLHFYDTRRSVNIIIEEENTSQENHDLAAKAAQYVYAEISNSNLSPEMLADHLGVSRRTLYRILETETGTTPATFIREIKLIKAQQLLHNDKRISLESVANQVGYRNAKSFRKLYQERFGIHPLDDRNKD